MQDYHYREKRVYWTDSDNKGIYEAELGSKTSHRKLVNGAISAGDGIAIDWVYDNIYWSNLARQTICVTSLQDGHSTDVIDKDLEKPRSIAVYPAQGWLFWSNWGNFPRIEKSGMDGSARSVLVTDNVMWPNGITLDLVSERLYWADATLKIIGSVNFDGTAPRIIKEKSPALHHPYSVSVLEDWVYWSDWQQSGSNIFRANKFDGTDLELITEAKLVITIISCYCCC